jgi:hypothetical protein
MAALNNGQLVVKTNVESTITPTPVIKTSGQGWPKGGK